MWVTFSLRLALLSRFTVGRTFLPHVPVAVNNLSRTYIHMYIDSVCPDPFAAIAGGGIGNHIQTATTQSFILAKCREGTLSDIISWGQNSSSSNLLLCWVPLLFWFASLTLAFVSSLFVSLSSLPIYIVHTKKTFIYNLHLRDKRRTARCLILATMSVRLSPTPRYPKLLRMNSCCCWI